MITILAILGAPAPAPMGGGDLMTPILMFGGIFFIMYFMMIRPQNKRLRAWREMVQSLKKNEKVITKGGILGIVRHIHGNFIVLAVDDGRDGKSEVRLRMRRTAIERKWSEEDEKAEKERAKDAAGDENK